MSGRTRGVRRSAFASGFALLLALVVLPGVVVAKNGPQPPGREAFQDIATAVDDSAPPPPTQAEIEASQDAYAGLSDDAALDLAQAEFADVLEAQLIPELDLLPGQEVDRYLGPYTAVITQDGYQPRPDSTELNPNLLVESTLPLRAPEAGEQAPLDADLVVSGDHFEADNPVVTAEIPSELEDGVELPDADVTVAPLGTEPTEAEPVEDKVFYPNADTDTDYLVAPSATGAEIFIQLRSQDSPESLPLEVEVPSGASLDASPDGGAVVRDADGLPVVTISAPVATDAAGQDVPVSYAISSDRVTVETPHRGAGYQYPIMVDPIVDQYNWGEGQPSLDHLEWWWGSSNGNRFNPVEDTSQGAGGLRTNARAGYTFVSGDFGEWLANSIRDSWIERVDFFNWDNNPTQPGACTVLGIWMPDQFQWAPITVQDPNNGNPATWYNQTVSQNCGPDNHQTRYVWVGNSPTYDGPYGDAEPYDHAMGIFALTSSPGPRSDQASNLLRSSYVYRYDRNNPTITSPPPSSAWTDQNPTFSVHDPGLGVAGVWIWGGAFEIKGTGTALAADGYACTGAHQHECQVDATLAVSNLPEGRHDYAAVGIDPILNGSEAQGWTARIDRSAPDIQPLAGSLVSNQNNVRADQSYSLDLRVTDGSLANADSMRSGVAKVEVFVDEEGTPRATWTQSCGTADGSCAMDRTWTVAPGEFTGGAHTIVVKATDALGHVSSSSVAIQAVGDVEPPQVDVQVSAPAADGSTVAHISATDPGAVASGLRSFEVYSGESLIRTVNQPCMSGGCQLEVDVSLTQAQHPDTQVLSTRALDMAGNVENFDKGNGAGPGYSRFGYSDAFIDAYWNIDGTGTTKAVAGGANVLRTYIDWCEVAKDDPNDPIEHSDPSTWHWGKVGTFFGQVNVKVVVIVLGSPAWANGGTGCGVAAVPPSSGYLDNPDPDDRGNWAGFINAVVQRYGSKLVGVQIWNEPNNGDFWNNENPAYDPREYAALVNEAEGEVPTSINVVAGGLSPTGTRPGDYLNEAARQMKASVVDRVALHLYANGTPQDPVRSDDEALNKIRGQYNLMNSSLNGTGVGGHDFWITEIGFSSVNNGKTWGNAQSQRRRLSDAWHAFSREPEVLAFIVHRLVDQFFEDPAKRDDRHGVLNDSTLDIKPDSSHPNRSAYCKLAHLQKKDPVVCQ